MNSGRTTVSIAIPDDIEGRFRTAAQATTFESWVIDAVREKLKAPARPSGLRARVLAIAEEMEDRQRSIAERAAEADDPGAFWQGVLFAFAAKLREAVEPDPCAVPFPLSEGELRLIGTALEREERFRRDARARFKRTPDMDERHRRAARLLCRVLDKTNPEGAPHADAYLTEEDES